MTAVVILAHVGHWLANLLYLAPVVIVVGALGFQTLKDRHRGDDADDLDHTPDPHAS